MNYGYYRPGLPFVVKNLIIINAIVFVVTMFAQNFMYGTFSLFYFTSPFFKPFQLITYMFMHGGFWETPGLVEAAINRVPTVGASGAIYGLLLAYGMMFPNNVLQFVFPPVAMKAKWMVIIFGAIELISGLSGRGGNVAHFAHLGGMIFGIIMILYWKKKNRLYS